MLSQPLAFNANKRLFGALLVDDTVREAVAHYLFGPWEQVEVWRSKPLSEEGSRGLPFLSQNQPDKCATRALSFSWHSSISTSSFRISVVSATTALCLDSQSLNRPPSRP